jgi:hypothetical protein
MGISSKLTANGPEATAQTNEIIDVTQKAQEGSFSGYSIKDATQQNNGSSSAVIEEAFKKAEASYKQATGELKKISSEGESKGTISLKNIFSLNDFSKIEVNAKKNVFTAVEKFQKYRFDYLTILKQNIYSDKEQEEKYHEFQAVVDKAHQANIAANSFQLGGKTIPKEVSDAAIQAEEAVKKMLSDVDQSLEMPVEHQELKNNLLRDLNRREDESFFIVNDKIQPKSRHQQNQNNIQSLYDSNGWSALPTDKARSLNELYHATKEPYNKMTTAYQSFCKAWDQAYFTSQPEASKKQESEEVLKKREDKQEEAKQKGKTFDESFKEFLEADRPWMEALSNIVKKDETAHNNSALETEESNDEKSLETTNSSQTRTQEIKDKFYTVVLKSIPEETKTEETKKLIDVAAEGILALLKQEIGQEGKSKIRALTKEINEAGKDINTARNNLENATPALRLKYSNELREKENYFNSLQKAKQLLFSQPQ